LAPGLYVTATPIGNLADITARALDVLAAADVIAAEDTRRTARLLAHHGLTTPMTPYHDHNAARALPGILRRLRGGASVALVSDAGTPLVSDPGYRLVEAAHAAHIAVHAVPGASAVLAALAVAGLPTDRFLYAGFLPPRAAARKRVLAELGSVAATLIVFESARRLPAALADMAAVLGSREAAVCRELTKLFEEVRRAPLDVLAEHYAKAGPPKGEVAVVIAPPAAPPAIGEDELDGHLRTALETLSPSRAAREVAARTGLARRRVYARALALAGQDERQR
jgi:16S rRNA (cytidine1402-2'-O)-methyltransferase